MKLMAYTDAESTETKEVNALYMNGYEFGDRLLEDVIFQITISNGELKAQCLNKYSKGINWSHWEQVCVECALERDVFSTVRSMTNDDGFIDNI